MWNFTALAGKQPKLVRWLIPGRYTQTYLNTELGLWNSVLEKGWSCPRWEEAGVGLLLSPWFAASMFTFFLVNDKVASLDLVTSPDCCLHLFAKQQSGAPSLLGVPGCCARGCLICNSIVVLDNFNAMTERPGGTWVGDLQFPPSSRTPTAFWGRLETLIPNGASH